MSIKILSKKSLQTRNFGQKIASKTMREKIGKASVLGLFGDLGSGKTTFVQGFAKGLGIKDKVTSPTFVIIRRYPLVEGKSFYHLDCYRIKTAKEILDLGWREMIENPANIIAVEWAENILNILPEQSLMIEFNLVDKKTREINVRPLHKC